MIERVLIAVGEERMHIEEITEHAIEIASALDASVTLLQVYTQSEFDELLKGLEYDSADPTDIAKRNGVVRDAASLIREAELELDVVGTVGTPAEEVANYVTDQDIDHVFIGGRKRRPTGKALLGSTSQDILLALDVPCTVFQLG
jgi:nucleotide-binding universal stress UspA family protein